jgi:hypothetical protein
MASDQPLVLAQCRFDNLQFRIDPDAADKLRQTLYEQWAQHSIAGAMAQFGAGTVLEQQSSGSGAAGVADAQLESALRSGLRNHIPLYNRAKEDSYGVRRGRHDEREATKAAAAAAAAASGDGDGSGS